MADINLTGVRKDIEMFQGNSIEIEFELQDVDASPLNMTGYDLRMQVRQTYASSSAIISATLANGKLAWVSQGTGRFKFVLAPLDTNSGAIRFPADSPDRFDGVYDLEVTAPTTFPGTQKPWYGTFSILREVTR